MKIVHQSAPLGSVWYARATRQWYWSTQDGPVAIPEPTDSAGVLPESLADLRLCPPKVTALA